MVGVAGKSKACHNCKARRVKCGLERPQCLRCSKASLKCLGYWQKPIFINRTATNPSVTAQDVITRLGDSPPSGQQSVDVVREYDSLVRMLDSTNYSTLEFRNVAFRILQRLYLPEKQFMDESFNIGALSWTASVCRCKHENLTLDYSLLAFCAAQLHVTHNGSITLNDVLQLYSDGLSRLSSTLQHLNSVHLTSIFASIVVLSTCELFIYPSSPCWPAHVQGIAELLQLGIDFPHQICSSYDWTQLCARTRVVSVITDLVSRRRGRLTAEQWRETMTNRIGHDPLDALLDIVSDLPEIFELKASPAESIVAMRKVLEKINTWESALHTSNQQNLYTFVPSQLQNPADASYPAKLYPTMLEFTSLSVASCLLVCWSAKLQTLSLCLQLHDNACLATEAFQPVDANQTVLDEDRSAFLPTKDTLEADASHHAQLLCQCVEYIHRIEMGTLGPQSMTYAKWTLQRYFEQMKMSRELDWCQNIPNMTSDHGTHRGIRLMDFHQ